MEEHENSHIRLDHQRAIKSYPYHEVVALLAQKYSKEGDSILDVGTGAANIPALVGAGRVIDVADAYQSCLDVARERATVRNAFLLDEVDFDVREVVGNRTYAVVTMSHVLEHMRDPIRAIGEVLSLLSPGGHLILAVPNPVTPMGFANALLRRNCCNHGHIVCWDRGHWQNFLERILRLEVVEYASDYVPIMPARLGAVARPLERGLASMLPWMSASHIAVVKKPT